MYEYRKLTDQEKAELLKRRQERGFPPHSPPLLGINDLYYLLTAACYEHAPIINSPIRRQELTDTIFELFVTWGMSIAAWVVLPNHYHLLVNVTKFSHLSEIFRFIHGRTALNWNREDNQQGRKVWYRYSDRAIRSERHYFTTLNYIHFNPVKHGHCLSPYDWDASSVHWYLEEMGQAWLRDAWSRYPVLDYGKKWDDL